MKTLDNNLKSSENDRNHNDLSVNWTRNGSVTATRSAELLLNALA